MLGTEPKPKDLSPKELGPEATEAERLLNEAARKLSTWAIDYKTIYSAKRDDQETTDDIPAGLIQLIEVLREALKNAKDLGVNNSQYEIILKLLDDEETEEDKAITLAGLEF